MTEFKAPVQQSGRYVGRTVGGGRRVRSSLSSRTSFTSPFAFVFLRGSFLSKSFVNAIDTASPFPTTSSPSTIALPYFGVWGFIRRLNDMTGVTSAGVCTWSPRRRIQCRFQAWKTAFK